MQFWWYIHPPSSEMMDHRTRRAIDYCVSTDMYCLRIHRGNYLEGLLAQMLRHEVVRDEIQRIRELYHSI